MSDTRSARGAILPDPLSRLPKGQLWLHPHLLLPDHLIPEVLHLHLWILLWGKERLVCRQKEEYQQFGYMGNFQGITTSCPSKLTCPRALSDSPASFSGSGMGFSSSGWSGGKLGDTVNPGR